MEPSENSDQRASSIVAAESLISVLGVVYSHRKTIDGGDLYLTRYGLPHNDLLEIDKWYEPEWFESQRERLEGTSAVYRVPTKEVNGRSIELVVKNCRVGEDVPLETRTLEAFINAEFNSPWEEFALVMELREGKFGPPELHCKTQEPLAIYVPPEKMQMWQSGRSLAKINRIRARHPSIDLDVLRQYKLIYGWIKGMDLVELFTDSGFRASELDTSLKPLTKKVMEDLEKKGYVVVDMKPSHIIVGEDDVKKIQAIVGFTEEDTRLLKGGTLGDCIAQGRYSVVDYELLIRTPAHETAVNYQRRHTYLDDQRDRFIATEVPSHLNAVEILGVPYIRGHVESTGGKLWVIGRNARLFDYFLPERWRKTHSWKLSENNEVCYTVTKDNIHIVWRTSRVGEIPEGNAADPFLERKRDHGFNSPFEAVAIAHDLNNKGVPVIYRRAIYMTGTVRQEQPTDLRRFESHRAIRDVDGSPILTEDRYYISVCGYFNGPDWWVAQQSGQLCRPLNLDQALAKGLVDLDTYKRLFERVKTNLYKAGYDGLLLQGNDLLLALDPTNEFLKDSDGDPEVRVCNLELVKRL